MLSILNFSVALSNSAKENLLVLPVYAGMPDSNIVVDIPGRFESPAANMHTDCQGVPPWLGFSWVTSTTIERKGAVGCRH
jgi:hypothetical protein